MTGVFQRLATRQRAARDGGAVAVIVALVVSTVLLGFAAFAVDIGNALAQRVDLQGIAAAAARAGAAELPTVLEARRAALENLCGQPAAQTHWNYAGCGSPLTGPTAADGTGPQIEIRDDEGTLAGTGVTATRISVTPPPIRVEFSFGQALGTPGTSITATSTAGIGTPTGYGVLPYFLTPADFTVEDVPDSSPVMNPSESYQRARGGVFCISIGRSNSFGAPCPPKQVLAPGTGTTNSEQGELNVPRAGTASNLIIQNTRLGLQFALHDWSQWPLTGSPRVPNAGSKTECGAVADVRAATFPSTDPATNCLNVLRAASSGNFTEQDGFFGTPTSRANRVCPGGPPAGSISSSTSADVTDLFGPPINPTLLDASKPTAAHVAPDFEGALRSESAVPVKGWIKSTIFRCGRLMLLPVLDAQLPVSNSGSGKSYPILGFAYAWIQDAGIPAPNNDEGYLFSARGRLLGLQGFILPRWYFPDVVYDSPTVGPYLGTGWPKQVVMMQ